MDTLPRETFPDIKFQIFSLSHKPYIHVSKWVQPGLQN